MICGACGAENRAGQKFCGECGTTLGQPCPNCAAGIPAGQKFCGECGTGVGEAMVGGTRRPAGAGSGRATRGAGGGPAASAGATGDAEVERRLVTILFADLVGFTTLSEGRDAEVVRDLLSRYFEIASDVIGRYGGTVEKFIGDAVMAVWGAPVAHEDDAERAVRAGLDLLDGVLALGSEAGIGDLKARAGILTGEAAVNLSAINQGMVAGDLVNSASRLQGVAEPGAVLVGEATMRSAGRAIAFEAAGEHIVKGKTLPVEAWRALRVVGKAKGVGRSDALEPPFVGRETEFRLLRELFHATTRDRKARLVSLTGQAGIGKSRLAWEFSKYTDGLSDTLYWHEGRSPAYGEGITFWALGEMVRKRASLLETDDDATSRERIAATLDEYVPDPEERALVEPCLHALLGLGDAPAGGRDRLFAGWRTFFERVADQGTVALIFEDLHWADEGLLDFIEYLLEWSRNYPIFVLSHARPELLDRRSTWGAGLRNATGLALQPLAEADMRALLAGLVFGLPPTAVATILARADGIPLYAVETVRTLVSDGRLVLGEDAIYRPVGDLGQLQVPDSLQGLIAARLDALDPANRSLLQDGAVLGKTFTVAALEAVSGMTGEALEERLRGLVRLEILELDTDPRSPERGQYGFVQGLIREVAYGMLSRRDRRAKHLAAARHFETLNDEELAGALATHYLAAYQAVPEGPEGAAVAGQARITLRAAADRAMALGSPEQATVHLERALAIPGLAAEDEMDLVGRAAAAAENAGHYDRAEELLERLVEHRRARGEFERLAVALASLGRAQLSGARNESAVETLEAALVEVAEAGEPAQVGLLAPLAHALLRLSRLERALEIAERLLPIAERHRQMEPFVEALILKGGVLQQVGRTLEASLLLDGARRYAESAASERLVIRAVMNTAIMALEEDPRGAVEMLKSAIDRARRAGIRNLLVLCVLNAAEAALRVGAWDWAISQVDDVLALGLEPADRRALAVTQSCFANLRGRQDPSTEIELDELLESSGDGVWLQSLKNDVAVFRALRTADVATIRETSLRTARIDTLNAPYNYERALRAALWMGDPVGAREILAEIRATGRRGAVLDAATAGLDAGLAALEGRRAESIVGYQAARSALSDLGLEFDLAMLELDACRFLGADTAEGRAAADVARALFTKLGAAPLLGHLERQVARARDAKVGPEDDVRSADPATAMNAASAATAGVAGSMSGSDG